MNNKKGDFNFVLLFAIIAGTAFLILAIFFAVKFGSTIKSGSDVQLAKSIDSFAGQLQAGFASSLTGKISLPKKSQIYPACYNEDGFGYNMLAVISESDFLKQVPPTPIEIKITDKYIFSQPDFGKEFYTFSKKFELGFPVGDLLFISTSEYCLVNPPERIKKEVMALDLKTLRVSDSINNTCSEDAPRICFGYNDDCNMTISGNCFQSYCQDEFETGTVAKDQDTLAYVDSLIYGAIFSEKDLYDCNVKRLLFRTSKIAQVYSDKIDLMQTRGCNSLLKPDLLTLSSTAEDADSSDLQNLFAFGKNLAEEEELERSCGLW